MTKSLLTPKKKKPSDQLPSKKRSKILASTCFLNPAFHLFAHRCIQGAKYESIATVLLSLHLFSSSLPFSSLRSDRAEGIKITRRRREPGEQGGRRGVRKTHARSFVHRSQGRGIPMSEVICSWTGSRVGFSIFTPAGRRGRCLFHLHGRSTVYGCPRTRERPEMVSLFSRQTAWCLRVPLLGHGEGWGSRPSLPTPSSNGGSPWHGRSRFDIEICLTSWKTQFGKSSMNPRSDKIEGLVLFFFSSSSIRKRIFLVVGDRGFFVSIFRSMIYFFRYIFN